MGVTVPVRQVDYRGALIGRARADKHVIAWYKPAQALGPC